MAVNRVDFGGKTLIDLSNDTVTPASLLPGYTAHNAAGEQITGAAETGEQGENTGSGANTGPDVVFYDYDGTVLYSYSTADALALTEMPELPEQDGLICQGWNWTLENMQAYVQKYEKCMIGANYITDDGKPRLYVNIGVIDKDITLYFKQTVSDGVIVEWGDDSPAETASGKNYVSLSHTYDSPGKYCITLDVTDGALTLQYSSYSSKNIFGTYQSDERELRLAKVFLGVASIGDNAFTYCTSLQSVTIPQGITEIGSGVFSYCSALRYVTIPQGMESYSSMFQSCSGLLSVTMPDDMASVISNFTFLGCNSLQSVTIPDGTTDIKVRMFQYCYLLSSITIPDSVETIDNYAFDSCYNLRSITIPKNVKSIGLCAFNMCYNLFDIYFLSTNPPEFDDAIFLNATNFVIYVPAGCGDAYRKAWADYADFIIEMEE